MNNYQQDQHISSATPVQQESERHIISRRRVLGGLAGITGLTALGGGFAFWRYRQSQTPVYIYRGQTVGPWEVFISVAWSPDGKRIAAGGSIQKRIAPGNSPDSFSVSWSVRIWDALTGQHMVHYQGMNYQINHLAWSSDSRRIAFSFGNLQTYVTYVLNAATGTILLGYPQDAYTHYQKGLYFNQLAIAWSPNGKRLASAGALVGTVSPSHNYYLQSWDALTGSSVLTYERTFSEMYLYTVAWSPDGTRIASGSWDGSVQVWNAQTGEHTFSYFGNSGNVNSVAWSPDSKYIVSCSTDSTVQVWLP